MLDDLPTELFCNVLTYLPVAHVCSVVPLINKRAHDVASSSNESFWKYLCEQKFHFQGHSKHPKTSWLDFSFSLDRSFFWDRDRIEPFLAVVNKGYSLSCYSEGQLMCALANSLLLRDRKYFELYIDDVPDEVPSDAQPYICIGVASSLRLNVGDSGFPIYGYYNTGNVRKKDSRHHEFQPTTFAKYSRGDRVGVVLNFEYMTVSFYLNDALMGTPYVYLEREDFYYPAVALRGIGTRVSFSMPPKMQAPPMPLR